MYGFLQGYVLDKRESVVFEAKNKNVSKMF